MPRMLLALLLPALAGAFVSTPAPALRASPWTGIHGLGWELRRPALVPLAHISRGGTVIAKSPSGAIGPSSDPPGRKPRRPRFPKLPKLPKFPKLESLPSPPPWLASVATRLAKYRGVWLVVLFALLSFALSRRSTPPVKVVELSYAAFMKLAANEGHRIESLRISLSRFVFLLDGMPAFTRPVRASSDLIWFLHANNIDFSAASTPIAAVLLPLFFPIVWLVALWSMLRRQMGGQQNVSKRASSRQLSADGLSFDDVAGIDSAKQEVKEVVSMLKNPARYAAAGARLPAGVLMVGPPGTGKTLLARVMAAQAGVPFFYCSGSDFVELFVGRGAARMRALFKDAAEVAPCIVFVDELDALGKMRSMRIASSNDEVEQTLNQMLACMDGLGGESKNVVVIGATNRYDVLDPALTRPGRFDRLVRIDLPDEAGRLSTLRVHTRGLKLAPDVSLKRIAAGTPTFSGAELAALTNEAAIRSVRRSVARMLSEGEGGEGEAAAGMAVAADDGSNIVNMADFNSALFDFLASRRKGVGGILGKVLG